MKKSNRRHYQRLRIDRSVQIQIQLFPVMPFIGESIHARLINISEGGMGLLLENADMRKQIKLGTKMKIHFRLPGKPLRQCTALVGHNLNMKDGLFFIGLRFVKTGSGLSREIHEMAKDNELCDGRIADHVSPWCDISCSFHNLCRKPLRLSRDNAPPLPSFEIALQTAE
jgi:c-di-GMP-binding flagellar brake protein YcgR